MEWGLAAVLLNVEVKQFQLNLEFKEICCEQDEGLLNVGHK